MEWNGMNGWNGWNGSDLEGMEWNEDKPWTIQPDRSEAPPCLVGGWSCRRDGISGGLVTARLIRPGCLFEA